MKRFEGYLIIGAFILLGFVIGILLTKPDAKFTLKTYTGVGAYVYKHGTIVKVVNGQPVVVGHFDDDSGKDYPGTVMIEEVK